MDQNKAEAFAIVAVFTLAMVGAAIGAYSSRKDDPAVGAFLGAVAAPMAAFAVVMVLFLVAIYLRCLGVLLT